MLHISALLTQKMYREQLTVRQAAKALGVSVPTMRSLLKKPAHVLRGKTLQKVAAWLNVSVEDLTNVDIEHAAILRDPIAVAIHSAGPVARAVVWAAIEAERAAIRKPTLRKAIKSEKTEKDAVIKIDGENYDSRQSHSEPITITADG